MQDRNVTIIPATKGNKSTVKKTRITRKKVAAYARVSTDSDEQLTSYDAQVDYYTHYIQDKPEWDFAGIYTDEGISGLIMKNRDGFNRMIKDALAGKIELIITKSVSRFARNTVDTLTTIRKLKEKGVEVYFEKENIYSLDSKGELMLTLMSSLAQEESRSLSQNVTWGTRKRFADGKVNMAYKRFLGYRKGSDGKPEIDPEQAKIVRRIYNDFISGMPASKIADALTRDEIPSPSGKSHWHPSTVSSILKNEKYKGDALLQKKFTVDYLTKTMKENEGEVPQYYVTDSHPAIIDPVEWDAVQVEIARRKNVHTQSYYFDFASKIRCGDCGGMYGRKVWHSNDKYRKYIWQCNDKFTGDHICKTPHLDEDMVKAWFLEILEEYISDKVNIAEDLKMLKDSCYDIESERKRLANIEVDLETVATGLKKLIESNAAAEIEESEYRTKYDTYIERFQKLEADRDRLEDKIESMEIEAGNIDEIVGFLENTEGKAFSFDPTLWKMFVDTVTVHKNGRVVFAMTGGREYEFEV